MSKSQRKYISFRLNGVSVEAEVEPRKLLVHHLRDDRGLTGSHVGCDTGQCGACAVLLDGRAVKSCSVLTVQVDGADVVTIEGIARPNVVQDALHRHHGLQCGFCTPGMVMAAIEMLGTGEKLDEEAVRQGLSGNMCRCTGYQGIVDGILDVVGSRSNAEIYTVKGA